jgi:cation diffusion facilitator family transporter
MKREFRAIQIAIACAIIGATAKFAVGIVTGSMSMISSAVDSLGDLFVSITNLFVVRVAGAAPDENHNYGHAKIEGLGAMFEGGFIFAAGAFIAYESVHKVMIGEESHDSSIGILVMLPVLAMTVSTVVYLRKVAKETGSLVVKSDALHYMTDVWVNVGVLVSLALVKLTGLPIIDSIVSMIISVYMIISSIGVVRAGFDVVMDKALDGETVKKVNGLLAACPKIESFHDFKTRTGRIPHVDFHVVVPAETTARDVHDLFIELQTSIREIVGPATKVLMHAEPAGKLNQA